MKGKRRRTRPKLEWDGWYTENRAFDLSEKACCELASIAGVEDKPREAKAMLGAVKRTLSLYPSMVEAVDQKPRSAHKLALLEPAMRNPQALARAILAWNNQDLLWDFTTEGLYFERAQAIAAKLIDRTCDHAEREELRAAAERVRAKLAQDESRHRRREDARAEIVYRLCSIFDYYDSNDYAERMGPEHTERPLSRNQLRAEFIHVALTAGGIRHPRRSFVLRASTSRLVRMLPPMSEVRRRLLRRLAKETDEPTRQELRQKLRSLAARQRRKHRARASILRAATRLRAEKKSLTTEQAIARVCREHPELYAAYRKAHLSVGA